MSATTYRPAVSTDFGGLPASVVRRLGDYERKGVSLSVTPDGGAWRIDSPLRPGCILVTKCGLQYLNDGDILPPNTWSRNKKKK